MSLALIRERVAQIERLSTPGLMVVLSAREAREALDEADRLAAAVDEQQGRVARLRGAVGNARAALQETT